MIIDVFTTCYNEEIILPYFLRHYKGFARNITVYDNMSTDNSLKILEESGVKIIPFNTNEQYDEQTLINIRNKSWKSSDADWVIVCDVDEFIYHKDFVEVLSKTDSTLITPNGYEMMSEELPTTDGQIYGEIKNGFFKKNYSKPCVFKPSEISNINFGPGSHFATPDGNVVDKGDLDIKLLHYKFINREKLIKQYNIMGNRQSNDSIIKGFGNEYKDWDINFINKQFDEWLINSTNIID